MGTCLSKLCRDRGCPWFTSGKTLTQCKSIGIPPNLHHQQGLYRFPTPTHVWAASAALFHPLHQLSPLQAPVLPPLFSWPVPFPSSTWPQRQLWGRPAARRGPSTLKGLRPNHVRGARGFNTPQPGSTNKLMVLGKA